MVTVSLLVLLTLVALGLLNLAAISLRTAYSKSAIGEARTNARLALLLAIGELQKNAGPDNRCTAPADIAGLGDGSRLPAGAAPLNDKTVNNTSKGLSAVQPGTRHWTGVFTPADTAASIYTKTPSPKKLCWLVSGDPSGAGPSPASTACTISPDGKVADPATAVVLVGQNSVGKSAGATEGQVAVPWVELPAEGSGRQAGRIAWWIGDEGAKARIDLRKDVTAKDRYATLTAQRRGWETVAGLDAYPTPGSPTHASLPKLSSLPQATLLLPTLLTSADGQTTLQRLFHSATTVSRGVLCDPLNGGTKVDLSALLAEALPAENPLAATLPQYPVKGRTIIPTNRSISLRAPRWDTLKEFHDRTSQATTDELIVKPATGDLDGAIAPLITDFRILMGARMRALAAGTFGVNPCGKIAIALANPYPFPLKWDKDLEIRLVNQTPPGNHPSRIWPLGGQNAPAFIPRDTSEPAVFQNVTFTIRPATLPPGEGRAYTQTGPVTRPPGSGAQSLKVELGDFAKSAPFRFSNCIELVNNISYNPPVTMDVRESWQTTLVNLEMGLAGSSGAGRILRRIERFELDNGYFYPNQRSFQAPQAAALTEAFPLMLFSYQISQPGADYKSLLPQGYELGQRSSTLRTFADFNLQATRYRKPITSYNPPPFFCESNDSFAQLPSAPPGGETGSGFTRNLAVTPNPWPQSPAGSRTAVLFGMPRELVSLAQFQHADLTGDDRTASVAHQPGNAVGNSYATPFVKRRLTVQSRADYEIIGSPNPSGASQTQVKYYDIAYLLNAALWDPFYLSGIPRSGTAPKPGSPALIVRPGGAPTDELRDPVKAATHLMVEGQFNVNSTDPTAWKALLASARHLEHPADAATAIEAAFPRSLEQPRGSTLPPSGTNEDSFAGFRRLSDAQLDALAGEIVKQVRLRGPFVSLSQFVNRALADIRTQPQLSRAGALQVALDESGANINLTGSRNAFAKLNPRIDAVTLRDKNGAPRADMDGTDTGDRPPDADPANPDWAATSTDNNFGTVASILADREILTDARQRPEQGYRSTGIPAWITQADVLQVIGSSLSPRSDTFRIRACGEALDASGATTARAFIEAVVQRVPDYVDPSDAAHERGADLLPVNQTHGRRFHIISLRWLSGDEI